MRATTSCPFCGTVTEVPHETQEGCIEALQREIARVRDILEHSTSLRSEAPNRRQPGEGPDPA
jgi:uncharacterized Zn finger protein (UPF0148 family)